MNILLILCALAPLTAQINFKCSSPPTPPDAPILASSNQTCPVNSHCLQNGFCDCDLGYVGGCSQSAYRMEGGVQIQAWVNNQTYVFFEIIGSTQSESQFLFTIYPKEQGTNSDFQIDIWDDDGSLDTLTKQNAESGGDIWNVNDTCLTLKTPYMLFGTKTNGETEGFILGLKNTQEIPLSVKINLEISEIDLRDLMVKILFILGSCFLLVLLAAIIFIIYKWRRRELFSHQIRENDISHLDIYMPKVKLQTLGNPQLAAQLCSICLIQLGNTHHLRKTVCSHILHQDCLDSWCKNHLSCPVCRRSFELEDLQSGTQIFEKAEGVGLRQIILR